MEILRSHFQTTFIGTQRAAKTQNQKPKTRDSYFFVARFFFPFDLRAVESAIATACFGGFPALISVRIFADTVLREVPFLSGIVDSQVGYAPPAIL
jgi:hypothetical protein